MYKQNHLINFENINWENPAKGIRYKKYVNEDQIIRLLEFSDGFIEKEYCEKGHVGYVLDGSFFIDYNEDIEEYKTGDLIFIPEGKEHKHKAVIKKGQKVLLLMFEINRDPK